MGCWDCKSYFVIQSKCMKKTCPDCYPDWAYRQGAHAAERMTEFLNSPDYMRRLQDAERDRWHDALTDPEASIEERRLYRIQTYHVLVTFPSLELSDRASIQEARKSAREIVRSHGIFGECSIPHRRHDDDPGAHFHFLAVSGYISPGRGDGTSYIFKVIQHEGRWHQRSLLDRLNVVRYACTHALITTDDEPSHCVTWSGCVANNKFPGLAEVNHIPQEHTPRCPHCGGSETFRVYERDWRFREEVETWTAPDRPPPLVAQRCLTEFA